MTRHIHVAPPIPNLPTLATLPQWLTQEYDLPITRWTTTMLKLQAILHPRGKELVRFVAERNPDGWLWWRAVRLGEKGVRDMALATNPDTVSKGFGSGWRWFQNSDWLTPGVLVEAPNWFWERGEDWRGAGSRVGSREGIGYFSDDEFKQWLWWGKWVRADELAKYKKSGVRLRERTLQRRMWWRLVPYFCYWVRWKLWEVTDDEIWDGVVKGYGGGKIGMDWQLTGETWGELQSGSKGNAFVGVDDLWEYPGIDLRGLNTLFSLWQANKLERVGVLATVYNELVQQKAELRERMLKEQVKQLSRATPFANRPRVRNIKRW